VVKITVKSDRQRWITSVDDILEIEPKLFWKHFSNFKRERDSFSQLKVDDKFAKNIADAFTNHFKSIFNTSCLIVTPAYSVTSNLSPAPVPPT